MNEDLTIDDVSAIFASGLFNYLLDGEGIVIHYEDHAYVIYRDGDEIKLNRDDALLDEPHFQMLTLTDDDDDLNDPILPDTKQIPKRLLN